jgi:pilus assembly protein Flp/PilA
MRTGRVGIFETETSMLSSLRQFFRDRRGVTAMEYALIAALIAVVIIGAVSLLGHSASKVFSTVANTI